MDSEKLVRHGLLVLSILSAPVPNLGASQRSKNLLFKVCEFVQADHVVLSAEVNPPAGFLMWRVRQWELARIFTPL